MGQGDHIGVAPFAVDGLLLLDVAQMIDLVPIGGGFLELQLRRCLFHGVHQVTENSGVLSLQKHGGASDVCLIVLGVDITDAGGGAAIDLILQTGAIPVAEEAFRTIPYAEYLL